MWLSARVALVVSVVAALLTISPLLMPWFQVNYGWSVLSDYQSETEFSVGEFETCIYVDGELLSDESHSYNGSYYEPLGDLMRTQARLSYLSVALSFLFAGAVARRGRSLRLALGFLAVASLVVLLMNVYFGIEDAINESGASLSSSSDLLTIEGFSGSKRVSIFEIGWGPAAGWWLECGALVLEALALAMVCYIRPSPAGR